MATKSFRSRPIASDVTGRLVQVTPLLWPSKYYTKCLTFVQVYIYILPFFLTEPSFSSHHPGPWVYLQTVFQAVPGTDSAHPGAV